MIVCCTLFVNEHLTHLDCLNIIIAYIMSLSSNLHQLSFTQLISVRKVQIVMFVLGMNNTYFDFFQDKVRRSLRDSNTILHGAGTSYWRRTV